MYIIYLLTICIVYDEEKFRYFIPCYESLLGGTHTRHNTVNMKNQQQLQQQQKKKIKNSSNPTQTKPLPS